MCISSTCGRNVYWFILFCLTGFAERSLRIVREDRRSNLNNGGSFPFLFTHSQLPSLPLQLGLRIFCYRSISNFRNLRNSYITLRSNHPLMFQKCLDNEEETADANSRATHQVPLVPQEQSSGVGLSRLSSNSVCDSFLTAGENASEISIDTSRSIRKTRSGARVRSLVIGHSVT